MAIDSIQFLQASNPYINHQNYSKNNAYGTSNYYQAQGANSTLPQISPSYKPTIEEYELAEKIANNDYNVGLNPFVNSTKAIESAKGTAFNGFEVPENNGTGELSPNYRLGREDAIVGLDFRA